MFVPNAIPDEPGVYQLVLFLPEDVILRVGALGVFQFPAGRYVYTGSALGGLRRRLARHLRTQKRLRWPIDYLMRHAVVEDVRLFLGGGRSECALNRQTLALPAARVIARGFGSSDCHCPAHLVYLGRDSCLTVQNELV
jgi:Uri superfamily endonuclease